jgi:hypothetical protein
MLGRARALALLVPLSLPATAGADERVQLRLDAAQAEQTLAIVQTHAAGGSIAEDRWQRLFASEPYRRLAQRESSLGRSFTEAEFRRFALTPELARRAPALVRALAGWRAADLGAAAERVLAYLPAESRIRATVYPVVKPRDNSFVFETTTDPAIFLYLDPEMSEAEFGNTVAHELHHIGLASLAAAYEKRIGSLPAGARKAAEWLGAFGEGVAVLAAAGSPAVHPVAVFGEEDRIRWDQDMRSVDQQIVQLDQYFRDLVDGGFARPEVADRVGFLFFGYRGPWYTVGYRMAELVERRFGRAALVETLADPRRLLVRYNQAAAERNAAGESNARWSEALLAALEAR